ncbi:hypothetical protein BVH03_21850 [Pseudomonas sp. PA15(2017)]|uniref:hypothetical protein n=1 Tax=Pseudomonas sp. PA15(2017) TaxID=1932111 RepID=UPI00096130FB|nr:hypothetical protein [Pseudomonas sp. PA15(2017)]OLU22899.1 hypothetical protein BVH03_21850 [Pseudomonas sp. PA15(2017)]
MSKVFILQPAINLETASAYSFQISDFDAETFTDRSANYPAQMMAGFSVALGAESIQWVTLSGVSGSSTLRSEIAGSGYPVGDTFSMVADASSSGGKPYTLGIRGDQPYPEWEQNTLPEVYERLRSIFGTREMLPVVAVQGGVAPPDPTAFWTQFDKAVEVI